MDWTAFSDPRSYPRLLAVAAMVGVAVWLVWLRPKNHAHRGFAIFLAGFGLAVFCNTMAAFAKFAHGVGSPEQTSWANLTRYFEFMEIPGLLYFISFYPRPRPWMEHATLRRVNLGLLAALALAVEFWMALDPAAWVTSASGLSGLAEKNGPVLALVKDNFWMAVVAVILAFDYGQMQPGARRSSMFLIWMGILINSMYDSAGPTLYRMQNAEALPEFFWNQVVYWINPIAFCVGILAGAMMLWSLRRTPGDDVGAKTLLVFLTLPLPVLASYLESTVARNVELFDSPFKLTSNGLVRLSLALLPAYALARYRILDPELQIKASLRRGLVVAIFAVVAVFGVLGFQLLSVEGGPIVFLGALAALVLLPFVGPLRRTAHRFTDVILPEDPDPSFGKRKLTLYKAAVEETVLEKRSAREEDRFLQDLRRRLGVSAAEHKALVAAARRGMDRLPAKPSAPTRFVPQRELGRGSSGMALLAQDTVLDRQVVLKRPLGTAALDAELRSKWLREAKLAARVQHPNVVTLLEVLADEDPPALVMQYVPGGSLHGLLVQERKLVPERALAIARDAAMGLAAIHDAGIVHRDLKPANVLIAPDGTAKITDFGIARPPPGVPEGGSVGYARPSGPVDPEVTRDMQDAVAGSLLYMSPEQLEGGSVDGRTDLYALGAILFEMAAGTPHLQLQGLTLEQMQQEVRRGEPRFGLLPGALAPIAMKALAKDPGERFGSAREMLHAIERALVAGASNPQATAPMRAALGHPA